VRLLSLPRKLGPLEGFSDASFTKKALRASDTSGLLTFSYKRA
jgi:hypothetical protein